MNIRQHTGALVYLLFQRLYAVCPPCELEQLAFSPVRACDSFN
jgi:hypothetical protein